jgi:hypothetical protein
VVFTTLVWPQIRKNILRSTYCSQAFNCDCTSGQQEGMCECEYCEDNASGSASAGNGADTTNCSTNKIMCPDNGSNTKSQ